MSGVRAVGAGLLALLLVGLPGCSGDDGGVDEPGRVESAGAAEPSGGDDTEMVGGECPLIASEAIADAAGVELDVLFGGREGCVFTARSRELQINIQYAPLAGDADSAAGTARGSCTGPEVEVEASEVAFVCTTAEGPRGHRYDGGHSWIVDVRDAPGPDDAITLAAALLPELQSP